MSAVGAGISPALDSSLPWLELGSTDDARWTGGAGQRRSAEGGRSKERHGGAVGGPIDSGEEQLMTMVGDGVAWGRSDHVATGHFIRTTSRHASLYITCAPERETARRLHARLTSSIGAADLQTLRLSSTGVWYRRQQSRVGWVVCAAGAVQAGLELRAPTGSNSRRISTQSRPPSRQPAARFWPYK
jgi:hypothetical protein